MTTPNLAAFMTMLAISEGTEGVHTATGVPVDSYRVCYAKRHIIKDFAYHPHELRPDGTREWAGEKLTDKQCLAAGFGPGCVSSAAGRYQINLPTFNRLTKILKTSGIYPSVQDDMCVQLLKESRALDMINRGEVSRAVVLCRHLWASLPGNRAGQRQNSMVMLIDTFHNAGGVFA